MRSAFTGAFAPYICGLIEKKQALGYDYHGSACILRTFDEFCREQFPNETCLTAELAMKWAEQFKTEKNLSRLNRVSVIRELAKYMNNPVAIEYIRNCLKRVRKRDSALVMASQNLEDFDQEGVREMTKPLFAIPPHQFLFNPGSIGKRFYMDMLQLDEAEFELIRRARRGECLYKCGMERYHLEVKAPTHKAVLFGSAGGR